MTLFVPARGRRTLGWVLLASLRRLGNGNVGQNLENLSDTGGWAVVGCGDLVDEHSMDVPTVVYIGRAADNVTYGGAVGFGRRLGSDNNCPVPDAEEPALVAEQTLDLAKVDRHHDPPCLAAARTQLEVRSRAYPCEPLALGTPQRAGVQERCRTHADGMEISLYTVFSSPQLPSAFARTKQLHLQRCGAGLDDLLGGSHPG